MIQVNAAIQNWLDRFSDLEHIYIAYSGGIDSHVLLHSCARMPELKLKMTAVYIHHGLQQEADDWLSHCARQGEALGIEFRSIFVNAQAGSRQSPEEAARNARYQALQALLKGNDAVLTGQHREDQMETILLQLFRGAGLSGLAGMPEKASLGQGWLIRPFLNISKQAICDYAKQYQLQWVDDPSNEISQFDRNFLRNEVLPLLTERWPSIAATVSRSGRHCADAAHYLAQHNEQQFQTIYDSDQQALLLDKLMDLPEFEQQQMIRSWFEKLGLRMPSSKNVTSLLNEIVLAKQDADPVLKLQGGQIRRYRNCLYYLLDQPLIDYTQRIDWLKQEAHLTLPHNGELNIVPDLAGGIRQSLWNQATVEVSYRRGGESLVLPGREGRHRLKKLFQEHAIPQWQRDSIPLIYLDGQLAAVADLWIDEHFYTPSSSDSLNIIWRKSK